MTESKFNPAFGDGHDVAQPAERPYEAAYDRALKEVFGLRESLVFLRDQIKPALQPEATEKATSDPGPTEPLKSAVVRDFDILRHEIRGLAELVKSISNRVYL